MHAAADMSWCFNEHSQVSALVRAHDWGRTSLGAIETWPMALKVTLSICLNSRFPMILWLGQDLTLIYNDAYIPWLGIKHPHVLGRPGIECWGEIWNIIGVALRSVLDTGVATWCSDQLLLVNRYNYTEESYWTYSYSPIFNEQRACVGVFTAVEETTGRYIGERRLRTLQQLSAATSAMETTDTVASVCEGVFTQNPWDVPFMALYLLSGDDSRHMRLCSSVRVATNQQPSCLPAAVDLLDAAPPLDAFTGHLRQCMLNNQCSAMHGPLEMSVPPELRLTLTDDIERPSNILLLPLVWVARKQVGATSGADAHLVDGVTPLGAIVLGVNARKKLDENYLAFINLLASSVTAALMTVRDYEREKKRAEALAELNRAKTTFFHNISHEFRTPLTLMLGPLEEYLERACPQLSEDQRTSLDRILRNGHRLLKLVNTLLDFSRIEAGRMRASFRPVNLRQLTEDLCSLFRSACERARLEYVVECQPLSEPVYVDVEMWEQIVTNVVANAFKYTLRGLVRVTLHETTDGTAVELAVEDTGCGIPQHALPHIFERFYRVSESEGRTGEGTGIGLAFLMELVKLHGGSVGVKSQVGKGSCFTVQIPYGFKHLPADQVSHRAKDYDRSSKKTHHMLDWWIHNASALNNGGGGAASESLLPTAKRTRLEGEEADSATKKAAVSGPLLVGRLLVADDNTDMLAYVSRILRDGGYDVATARDGEAALEALIAADPPVELVVSDIMMPRLDGRALVRAIRTDERIKHTPVILVSARAGEEERSDGIAAGADDYLVKPFSSRELLARVAARLEIARERQKAAREEIERRRSAESANAAKDQFIAVLSHELRTPLAPVLMLAEAAEQDMTLPASVRHDMGLIAQNVRLEIELISDLLDAARIRQKKLVLRTDLVDVHSILHHSAELYRHQLLERKLCLKMSLNAATTTIVGDATRLEQIFWNLLGNAVKFTPSGGVITVATENRARDGDASSCLVVSVTDNGRGIDPAVLPNIFNAWEQGNDDAPRVLGGLGLGLSIAKNLVRMHSGDIEARSDGRGKGAMFIVTLPLPPLAVAAVASEECVSVGAPHGSLSGLRVLVVEDNLTSLAVLARLLERLGCEVLRAVSVAEACALIGALGQNVDVLISDIGLPDGSGHEVMQAARRLLPHLRGGIALSGFGSDEDMQRSLHAGFSRHLTKPARLRELHAALAELAHTADRRIPVARAGEEIQAETKQVTQLVL